MIDAQRARADGLVRVGAMAVLWLSLLLVCYWWVADGGVQELGGWATGLTTVGRLSGLVSAVLLLAQVVLMARVPWLEAAFGQDRLARMHRLTGFTSFNLMLVHVVAITWGYAEGELSRTPATLWDLTVNYPGMLLAVAGSACLFLSVGTSIRAARRRIRYESWHLLHLYAYLGVGLALPHQLWTGTGLHVVDRSDRVLVDGLGGRGSDDHRLPGRRTDLAQYTASTPGDSRRPRVRPGGVAVRRRPTTRPAARGAGAVLLLALPRPARMDPGEPLLVVRRTGWLRSADHRAGDG